MSTKCRHPQAIVFVGLTLMAVGCGGEHGPDKRINGHSTSSLETLETNKRQGKRLSGIGLTVRDTSWEEFIKDKIVVDVEGGTISLNRVRFPNQSDAKEECLRLVKESNVMGIVIILHDKAESAQWFEEICEDYGLDCLIRRALGGMDMSRHESFEWVHRGGKL